MRERYGSIGNGMVEQQYPRAFENYLERGKDWGDSRLC